LKYFKDYRFHPEFTKDVAGGYKSITYSNNINAFKEFCRFELAGGICNDATCEFQHFRDIALPGAWNDAYPRLSPFIHPLHFARLTDLASR
jgi:hypothetical protein